MHPDQFEEHFAQQEQEKGPFDFPLEVQEDIDGLRYLGYLTSEVEFCGHAVTLKTLNADEEIAAALACKSAKGSAKEVEAFMKAMVGMALTNVDGEENFCPPTGPNLEEFAKARYRYTGKWYQPTVDYFYVQYVKLVERQVDAIRAFQDFSVRNLGQHSPWPGSSTGQGISPSEIPGVTLDSD
jgi:hypothetical protein